MKVKLKNIKYKKIRWWHKCQVKKLLYLVKEGSLGSYQVRSRKIFGINTDNFVK